jgi:hypothetical protein
VLELLVLVAWSCASLSLASVACLAASCSAASAASAASLALALVVALVARPALAESSLAPLASLAPLESPPSLASLASRIRVDLLSIGGAGSATRSLSLGLLLVLAFLPIAIRAGGRRPMGPRLPPTMLSVQLLKPR